MLLTNFDDYLIKQRGLRPRTIYNTLRFADRPLDHRFGDGAISLAYLRPADVIGLIEHVLVLGRRDKTVATHVRIFLPYLFGCGATASNMALSLP